MTVPRSPTRRSTHTLRSRQPWQRAEVISTYGLLLSADELSTLAAAVDGLLRPYIGLTRSDAPADAERVHVVFEAFRRPVAGLPA